MFAAQARFPAAIRRIQAPRVTRRAGPIKVVAFQETSAPPAVQIKFSLPMEVAFGQSLSLVGSVEALGGWEVAQAVQMDWNEGNIWTAAVALPPGTTTEFKLVLSIPGEAPVWEHSANRVVSVPEDASALTLDLGSWSNPEAAAEPIVLAAPAVEEVNTDLLTPPFQAAVDSVKTFFNGGAAEAVEEDTNDAAEAEDTEALAAADAMFAAETATIDEEEDEELAIPSEEVEAVAAEAVAAEEEANPTVDVLKTAAKTAGAVALGVAGAALLSALAIDVTETAVVGALAVAAGGAALSGATPSKSSNKTVGEDGEEEAEDGEAVAAPATDERRIKGAGETGVIIAAGVLSALDAGKKAAELLGAKSTPADEE